MFAIIPSSGHTQIHYHFLVRASDFEPAPDFSDDDDSDIIDWIEDDEEEEGDPANDVQGDKDEASGSTIRPEDDEDEASGSTIRPEDIETTNATDDGDKANTVDDVDNANIVDDVALDHGEDRHTSTATGDEGDMGPARAPALLVTPLPQATERSPGVEELQSGHPLALVSATPNPPPGWMLSISTSFMEVRTVPQVVFSHLNN